MDRNRDARRVALATSNGLQRRRHRTSSLRDSPEDDGALDVQESARFRDRTGKRDRDRDKERSERDRSDRDRERDRLNRSKRRRGEKFMHGSNREDGVDDSSDESINDEEEEDPEDGPVRFMPPNPVPVSSSSSQSSALTSSRKSYPPPTKVFKVVPTWKAADEMIGFSIPRKARSASTKRSHDWSSSGVVAGEQFNRQTSSSPVRPSMAASPAVASPSPAPLSPSSSNLSMKKKIKANGPKQRPPKCATQSSSSIQDDIEIEVAEVLYGLMRQSHVPSKPEMMSNDSARYESKEVHRSSSDSKQLASSPASNSASAPAQDSSSIPQNCNPAAPPLSAVAPKRKRPRLPSQLEENSACLASRSSTISTAPKILLDLPAKQEVHSLHPEKKSSDSLAENGGVSSNPVKPLVPDSTREPARSDPASAVLPSAEKHLPVADQSEAKDTVMGGKLEEVPSPKKEPVDDRVDFTSLQQATSTTAGDKESRREEKLEIDLMAPPPQSRSPEREGGMDHRLESTATDGEAEIKSKASEGVEAGRSAGGVNTDLNTEVVEKGSNSSVARAEGFEIHKSNLKQKARYVFPHLDLERSAALNNVDDHKLNQHLQKQPPQQPPESKPFRDDTNTDKSAQAAQPMSVPLSMPVPAGWPAGLPPMGYVAPLQGMVPMDGRAMAPAPIQPPHFLFTQPRPGRCATHCYIAKNIFSHQQFMKNYPFWPAAPGAAPLFGAKPYNLNLVPAAELHGSAVGAGRGDVNPVQDKGQTFAFFPGQQPAAKDKGAQPATNVVDGAQKKQLYQNLPPGGPNNMLHGPATLFFPMGQQQQVAAAAAASGPGKSAKSPVPAVIAASAGMPTSGLNAATATGQASPATMSFNYPNMPANDTQYLAILANGAYQFPVPTHVGAAQAYRGGAHPQVMPFFSGSYYSSQVLHPSQMQQQQQQGPPPSQSMQIQSGHQNPNISTASSSSQKQSQNQQQRPQGNSANGVTPNTGLQTFPIPKSRASQTQQLEMSGDGSPSTADSRFSRPPNMSVYGQNYAMPFNPPNFALMQSPASLSGATTGGTTNGSHSEKKQQQQQPHGQQQAMAPQAFAMSFASINGATTPGLDITSMEQNHAIFQNLPEAARNNYHMMAAAAAAQAAQQKKNYHGSDDGKSGGALGSSNADDERKGMSAKGSSALTGQSIAFSRPDMVETSTTAVSGNNVVDSSARSLNLAPGSTRSSRSSAPNSISNAGMSAAQQQQQQLQQQQMQQQHQYIQQLQKQQKYAAAVAQNKAPVTSNGSVYSDHLSPSSAAMSAKFPNALSGYPPSMVQGNSSSQSQWKNSGRTISSQVSSPSMSTSSTTSMKNHGQQGRPQSGHTQISFGGNAKANPVLQGQQGQNPQSPSPPMRVGSPSTSSVSKGHSATPRMTTSSSVGNKPAQASSLSTQPGRNSPSTPSQKSSPVPGSGRNVQSVFGNSHMPVSAGIGNSKVQPQPSLQQLQQQSLQQLPQPQLSKQSIQQAQMFFGTPYMQTHPTTTSSAASAVGGFQLQRHRPDQQQQQQQQQQQPPPKSQGPPTTTTSSSGMLSMSPAPANPSTNDPAKAMAAAAAAAANNIKGGMLHAAQYAAQASGAAHTFVSAGFPYVHAVPAGAVQVKQAAAEQKQPAGNENLPASWQPEKK